MSIQTKQRLVGVLRAFNYIGLIILLFLTVTILAQIKRQAIENNMDNARIAERIEKDHDLQNQYLQCLVNLFIEAEADIVTPEQSALCLEQVRGADNRTTTIEPTAADGGTTSTSQSRQPVEARQAQQQPQTRITNPPATSSAPPDPPTQEQSSQPTPEPSIVETLTRPITNLL